MRVIAGSAKGRKLTAPKGPGTRPALAQVKEAIFNILASLRGDITGLAVLDLYAGSGAIGIEALSRGALHCTFVERESRALSALRENLERTGFTPQAEIVPLPVERVLKHLAGKVRRYELIFVDPPYDCDLVMPSLALAEKVLADAGTVIVENSPREPVEDTEQLTVTDRRKYGQTNITFLQRNHV